MDQDQTFTGKAHQVTVPASDMQMLTERARGKRITAREAALSMAADAEMAAEALKELEAIVRQDYAIPVNAAGLLASKLRCEAARLIAEAKAKIAEAARVEAERAALRAEAKIFAPRRRILQARVDAVKDWDIVDV